MHYSTILAVLPILVIVVIFLTCISLKQLKKKDEQKLAMLLNQIKKERILEKKYARNSDALTRKMDDSKLALTSTCLKLVNFDFTVNEILKFH